MSDIDKRIDALAKTPLNPQGVSSSSSLSLVALPPMTGTEDIVQADVNEMDPMQREQWIMELMSNNGSWN
ncbi:hypothetical protein Godav_011073 [Gossypium davidsonii]|uniref:Uncharacterized protein n=1 Tax=Gossypium davidsonii TaxID=34287 RepID=A0A7J8R8N8_GOSDV|nr:hypothetical protein [Gossypium davidsonii]